VSAARNKGIAEARSELIAFLDADDEWESDYLETVLRLKSKFPDCDVYATSYLFAMGDGPKNRAILRGIKSSENEFRLDNYFEVAVQSDPPLWTSAVAVSKMAINAVGGFPAGVKAGEDLLTWARLAVRYRIAYAPIPKSIFHLRASLTGMPTRLPDDDDMVGRALEGMLAIVTEAQQSNFAGYLALWHRMRATVYLQTGRKAAAMHEIRLIGKYSSNKLRYYILFFIACMPLPVMFIFVRMLNCIKNVKRIVMS
jgi:glycosyltransferase involved in cell wall biosynthesis